MEITDTLPRTEYHESLNIVEELPAEPISEGHYSFLKLNRKEVTELNHGLHKYPAKFIPQLPRWALGYAASQKREAVLDPFCGSGTTLVEAGLLGHQALGCDISPLAVIISKAKTARIIGEADYVVNIISGVVSRATQIAQEIFPKLTPEESCLGLHRTWSFWFRTEEMSKLLALRQCIEELDDAEFTELKVFLFACLSSIAKSASYLNEDQIKVRYDREKTPDDPLQTFSRMAVPSAVQQIELGKRYVRRGAQFDTQVSSATDLPFSNRSVDRVITSPPYINAVDYTMAHKYNLFVLGLIHPTDFKNHCRDYIGLTERAVRASDILVKPQCETSIVEPLLSSLWSLNTPVSKNRAFVVAQYFNGMYRALQEMWRVLKNGRRAFVVVGGSNRICGITVPTAEIVQSLAEEVGFGTELRFYHHLANRSSMRLNRAQTGGKVSFETICVFRKR